ncbi:flavodoxin domain-containing protein [Chitinophaga ginsengisegetis]|uniref:flavodoxin domain-containing protein n=1 Tax=Chitinophaga ginsengisegetis TaxID=393003 RepID=UPI000DBA6E9A|nr:flavodoxin domain-containing protein [Chitinophaga ginsengisegetis]MDR6568244.1 menaquinone-dependent protoporphyrinogen IX oxidase [Chitinophaga ginsengisegetis]MDR6648525.1 menaquinone-dependent protoporphyrinogen IX oxidase [Chitinophaga ginsengisegetis]MDR6654325.1 menaquinone-dependent protoporphyrinogen IX oxidase [Chitinophaga ginsengisegetis]
MKGLIIYKGKYGATRQYSLWLGSMLGWPVIPAGSETAQQLADADCIILGSSIYIGKLQLRKWLEQHGDAIISKRLFLFLVSGTPSSDKGKLEGYLAANISESLRSRCVPFFLPGKLEFNKLSWIDKLLLTIGSKLASDKTDDISMEDYNDVKKEHLEAIFNAVRKPSEVAA